MNIVTTNTLDTLEGIMQAIAANKNAAMVPVFEALLASKKREIELAEKVAKTKTSTKKSAFTVYESMAKALFVALRPYVDEDGIALRVFNAAVAVLSDNDLSVELQEKIFSTSTWHCAKSNFNKCVSITAAYDSYRESVKQAKVLLPFIEQVTWSDWEKAIIKAAKAAAAKRGETWLTPAEQSIKAAAEQVEIIQAAKAAKAEQAAEEAAKTVAAKRNEEAAKIAAAKNNGKKK